MLKSVFDSVVLSVMSCADDFKIHLMITSWISINFLGKTKYFGLKPSDNFKENGHKPPMKITTPQPPSRKFAVISKPKNVCLSGINKEIIV